MNIKQLFSDERAVSPVIGVILMVAITVILAAVIGTFVLGLGDDLQDTSPTASISMDFDTSPDGDANNPQSVTISHTGGDTISDDETLTASVTGDKVLTDADGDNNVGTLDDDVNEWDTTGGVSSGDSKTFYVYEADGDGTTDAGSVDTHAWDGETVRLNWESVDGGSSATLGSSTAP